LNGILLGGKKDGMILVGKLVQLVGIVLEHMMGGIHLVYIELELLVHNHLL
jgi:hypothetical protein